MPLTLWDIDDLINRKRDPIWAGEIPHAVALELGLANPNVYLSRKSLGHIFERHKDVTKLDLLHLPFLIKSGLLTREKLKRHIVMGTYQDPASSRRFIAAMKIVNRNTELWVSSFYRAHRRQTISLLKKGAVLKTHD